MSIATSAPCLPWERLELQPALAGAVGERGDAAVIEVAAAIEDHLVDALREAALRERLAHLAGGVLLLRLLGLARRRRLEVLVARGGREQRLLGDVVDDLRVD